MISIALIASLLFTAEPKKCTVGCQQTTVYRGKDVEICFYDELPACAAMQPECKDSSSVVCKNRVANLGKWDVIRKEPICTGYGCRQ